MPAALAILVGKHGRGSNMAAIAEACDDGRIPARIAAIIAPSEGSQAVQTAVNLGLAVTILRPDESGYETRLLETLEGERVDWVCLAGFMRLLPVTVLAAYPEHVLNIHPALLPKFGGKGMYGMTVHEAVIAAGESESGCTVHLVNEHYDEGKIVLQMKCPVLPGDSPETLADRVLTLEHAAYVEALRRLIVGEHPSGS